MDLEINILGDGDYIGYEKFHILPSGSIFGLKYFCNKSNLFKIFESDNLVCLFINDIVFVNNKLLYSAIQTADKNDTWKIITKMKNKKNYDI